MSNSGATAWSGIRRIAPDFCEWRVVGAAICSMQHAALFALFGGFMVLRSVAPVDGAPWRAGSRSWWAPWAAWRLSREFRISGSGGGCCLPSSMVSIASVWGYHMADRMEGRPDSVAFRMSWGKEAEAPRPRSPLGAIIYERS